MKTTVEETLREIVSRIAETPPGFALDAHLRDDLKVDSFHAVEIVFEIERLCDIKIPDSRYGEVQTFSDLLNLVTSLKG
jgi:acyl carrier protein